MTKPPPIEALAALLSQALAEVGTQCDGCGAIAAWLYARGVQMQDDTLYNLWNGDIKVTAEQAQWIRQALDAQHPVNPVQPSPAKEEQP